MQLKAFVRSVRIAPKTLLLSTAFFYLTICLSSKEGNTVHQLFYIYYQNDLAVAFTLAFQTLWRQQVKYLRVYIYPYDF